MDSLHRCSGVLHFTSCTLMSPGWTWFPFYPKQIKSQQHPSGLPKTPASSFREPSTLLLQVRGPMADEGQAVRGRERQRGLLRAPCAGQGEELLQHPMGMSPEFQDPGTGI